MPLAPLTDDALQYQGTGSDFSALVADTLGDAGEQSDGWEDTLHPVLLGFDGDSSNLDGTAADLDSLETDLAAGAENARTASDRAALSLADFQEQGEAQTSDLQAALAQPLTTPAPPALAALPPAPASGPETQPTLNVTSTGEAAAGVVATLGISLILAEFAQPISDLFSCGTLDTSGCDKQEDTAVDEKLALDARRLLYGVGAKKLTAAQAIQALSLIAKGAKRQYKNLLASWYTPYKEGSCGGWFFAQTGIPRGSLAANVAANFGCGEVHTREAFYEGKTAGFPGIPGSIFGPGPPVPAVYSFPQRFVDLEKEVGGG